MFFQSKNRSMKKLIILSLFISGFGFGQFFESSESESENQFFESSTPTNPNPPEQGEDRPGAPAEPVPLDDWLFLLPLAGIAVGAYYLRKRKFSV